MYEETFSSHDRFADLKVLRALQSEKHFYYVNVKTSYFYTFRYSEIAGFKEYNLDK